MKTGKKLLGIISGLMVLCIVFAWMMPMQTQAASKKRKAMKAYKKYLSQTWLKYYDFDGKEYEDAYDDDDDGDGGMIEVYAYAPNVKFATAYINKDKIPELIVYVGDSLNTDNVIAEHPCGQLYTYKSGKVKCLGGFSLWEPSKSKYYKKKNLIADYAYSDASDHDIQYLRMSGNKIKLKLIKSYYTKETMEEFDMKKSIEYYDWTNGNEEISKKQFNKRLKKLKGNKSSSKFKWHKNTKKNRKKYLK